MRELIELYKAWIRQGEWFIMIVITLGWLLGIVELALFFWCTILGRCGY